jgi:hypothetical protein
VYVVSAVSHRLSPLCFATSLLAASLPCAAEPPAQAPDNPLPQSQSAPLEPAPAAPSVDQGLSFGLRTGWSIPIGSLEKNDSMRSNFTGMVPFWLDGGYRLSKHLYLGAYFQLGPVFVNDDVCRNLSCSAYDLRFGINAHWHFKWSIAGGTWAGRFDPWLGIGSGYEGATVRLSTPLGARSSETRYGFEYGNIQLGGDYQGSEWRLGAFASLSAAQYARLSRDQPDGSSAYSIEHPTAHLWLTFGVRFQYDL